MRRLEVCAVWVTLVTTRLCDESNTPNTAYAIAECEPGIITFNSCGKRGCIGNYHTLDIHRHLITSSEAFIDLASLFESFNSDSVLSST